MKFFLVFLGGGIGSVFRYLLAKINLDIPYGTFLANIFGSFLIGLIIGFSYKSSIISENNRVLLATGFCGGFTTFSSFAYESHLFIKSSDYLQFILYTTVTFTLGLLMVFLGVCLSE